MPGKLTEVQHGMLSEVRPSDSFSGDDDAALAACVAKEIDNGLVLDLCAGTGRVGLGILQAKPNISVVGFELVEDIANEGIRTARATGLDGRMDLRIEDVLAANWPSAQAASCNPPLIPGETGYLVEDGEQPAKVLWHEVVKKFSESEVETLYMHLFDFNGIVDGNGSDPSAEDLVADLGLELEVPYTDSREISATSALRQQLGSIARLAPDSPILVDRQPVTMAEAAALEAPGEMSITHSVARFSH